MFIFICLFVLLLTNSSVEKKFQKYWRKYYSGDESQQQFKRKYSFSDRSRYYWPNEKKTIEIMRPSKTFNELLDKF